MREKQQKYDACTTTTDDVLRWRNKHELQVATKFISISPDQRKKDNWIRVNEMMEFRVHISNCEATSTFKSSNFCSTAATCANHQVWIGRCRCLIKNLDSVHLGVTMENCVTKYLNGAQHTHSMTTITAPRLRRLMSVTWITKMLFYAPVSRIYSKATQTHL